MSYSFNCKSFYHKKIFSEHVFIKISYCVFKIMILKMKKEKQKKLEGNLCGFSTESFLAIWLSQHKFLTNEFLIKEKCVGQLRMPDTF